MKKKNKKIHTHFVESSDIMVSQRFNDELFIRIPRNEFGGKGKLGRWKSFIFTEYDSWSWESDCSKASWVTPENESKSIPIRKNKYLKKTRETSQWYENQAHHSIFSLKWH